MGTFRFLLAATVMLGHYFPVYPQPLPFVMYGTASVPAFYIVSGFLITLVLEERYGGRIGLFYSNRALRICSSTFSSPGDIFRNLPPTIRRARSGGHSNTAARSASSAR
jgi:hypothetical protein